MSRVLHCTFGCCISRTASAQCATPLAFGLFPPVAELDHGVKEIVDALKEAGMWNDSIIVCTLGSARRVALCPLSAALTLLLATGVYERQRRAAGSHCQR